MSEQRQNKRASRGMALVQRLILCAIILFFSPHGALFAHRDALIQLKGTQLVGLPGKFAPAELDLKAARLRIGNVP
jgi:hypothetical protein